MKRLIINARQKAKHFKRLYEQSLPKKPYPVVYDHVDHYQHYRVEKMIRIPEAVQINDMLQDAMADGILKKLKTMVKNAMVCHRDDRMDALIYSLDFYLRKGFGNDQEQV